MQDSFFEEREPYSDASLVLPLVFAQPAFGRSVLGVSGSPFDAVAGWKNPESWPQGTGATGAKSGMGAGHADANHG